MDKPAYVGFGMAFSHPPPRRTLPDSNKYVQKIAKALGNTIASRGQSKCQPQVLKVPAAGCVKMLTSVEIAAVRR